MKDEECGKLNKYGLEITKGIVLYNWLGSVDKLNVTSLPPEKSFYSELKQEGITDEKLEREVLEPYKELNNGNYIKTDVLIGTDVIYKIRDECVEYYKVDPCYTYSTGLTWLCGLKYNGVRQKYYKKER